MARYGIIDLGSNSVRLVIYEVKRAPSAAKPFRALVDEKKMAGLAAYVEAGMFTEAGVARAASVLSGHMRLARNLACERVDIFATAVLRNCSNSAAATSAIEAAAGVPVRVLSAAEEAHLGWAGARVGTALGSGTLIDIGGGSTEITPLDDQGRPRGDWEMGISLPQGSVSSYAQFVTLVLPGVAECRAMANAFRAQLDKVENLPFYQAEHLYGIGGSVRAIAKMQAQASGEAPKPSVVTREQIDELFSLLERDASAFAHAAVKACPDRVHTLVPGMVIARTLLETLDGSDIAICKHGIREGYLMECVLGMREE